MQIENEVIEVKDNLPAESSEDILDKINNISTKEDLKNVVDSFNLNITKKEMSRAIKQDELLDLILQQAGDRLKLRPDEISTKDLLEYMNTFQANIEKSKKYIDDVTTKPSIQINQNHRDVVVNVGDLSRDSNERVVNAVKDIIASLENESLEDLLKSVEHVNTEERNDAND